ncbi:unnamed protein product [Caenorhabditis auriculariae]|uniref:A20-type domain-containing protein n=1 Tax=Caenorhabditis auriculariae TaxID=2777116 RepID=A0A8S1HVG7_9PELO|nr:unnamed protein product [Caenorhabditis auriculariae]
MTSLLSSNLVRKRPPNYQRPEWDGMLGAERHAPYLEMNAPEATPPPVVVPLALLPFSVFFPSSFRPFPEKLECEVFPRIMPSKRADDDESKRIKVQIREKDLLCVNGCGFYGTPQWENRCSKCWRAHQVVVKRDQDFARNRTLLSFDQFQERRKTTLENRMSIKRLYGSTSSLLAFE